MRWLAIFGSCRWQWFQRQLARFGMPAASAKSQLIPLRSHGYSERTFLCFSTGGVTCYPTSSTERFCHSSFFFTSCSIQRSARSFKVLLSTPTLLCTFPGGAEDKSLVVFWVRPKFNAGWCTRLPKPVALRLAAGKAWFCLCLGYLFKSNDLWQWAETWTWLAMKLK